MLLQMFLMVMVMIAGFSGVVVGSILMATGLHLVPGLIAVLVGLPVGVASLRVIIRLNREYQEQHLQAVLRDPTEIVARWPTDEGEVILAQRGLFIGRAYRPFNAGYQKLKDIDLTADGRTLRLEFDIVGAASSQKVEVEVAPEVVEVIREFFAKHRAAR